VKDYIRSLNIKECNDCEEIRALQAANNKNIKVAPLFWQGEGRAGIPLVIMGINPSVVGTENEPKRGCVFETYFNYYQNRKYSEKENIQQANEREKKYGSDFFEEEFTDGFSIENLCRPWNEIIASILQITLLRLSILC